MVEPPADQPVKYLFGGETGPVEGTLDAGHVGIFQDSANKDRWNLHADLQGKTENLRKRVPGYFFQSEWKIGPARFRGYKIINDKKVNLDAGLLGSGDHAPGWAAAGNDDMAVSVHMQRFWKECPKAIVLGRSYIEPLKREIHPGARRPKPLCWAGPILNRSCSRAFLPKTSRSTPEAGKATPCF